MADLTRGGRGGAVDERVLEADRRSDARPRRHRQPSAQRQRALLDAEQAEPARTPSFPGHETTTVVAHLKAQRVLLDRQRDDDLARVRVTLGVHEGLLRDPVEADLNVFVEAWNRDRAYDAHRGARRLHPLRQ